MPPPHVLAAPTEGAAEVPPNGWEVFVDVASQVTVLLALAGALWWLVWPRIRAGLRDAGEARTHAQRTYAQVAQSNDGRHFRDIAERIESKVDRIDARQARDERRLDRHIRDHPGREE